MVSTRYETIRRRIWIGHSGFMADNEMANMIKNGYKITYHNPVMKSNLKINPHRTRIVGEKILK